MAVEHAAAGRPRLIRINDARPTGAHAPRHDPGPSDPSTAPAPRCREPTMRTLAATIALALTAGGVHASDAWKTSGDVRLGYVASETTARSGAGSDADSLRARVRLRLRGDLGGGWHFSGRVAARLDSDQSNEEFWLRTYAPGPSGLEDGQGTIDEAYLEYRPVDSPWSLRVGRFQAAWGLDDVM